MQLNPSNFLLSLASALAAAVDGVTLGTNLFIHQLPPSEGGGPNAVLRVYGGPAANELLPVPAVSVQCMTRAMDAGEGMAFAWSLYAALFDSAGGGEVRHHWTIDALAIDAAGATVADADFPGAGGWEVRLITPGGGGPGLVGRDDAGRWEMPFNFNVRFSTP